MFFQEFCIGLLALSLTEDVDQRLFWLKLAPPSFHLTAWHLLHLLDLKLWSGAVFSHEIAFPNILAGGCGQFADAIKGGSATKYLAEQIELNRALYPQSMSLQADLVKAGMIPACAEKRASLNIVTICANFLDQAYSEFPEPEFTPVCKENIMKFPKNERMMRAESGYATSVDGFLSGSVIWTIDEENGTEYIYENGKKREMDAKGRQAIKQQQQKREDYEPPYGTWTSQSGKWTATYSRDGALTLHDGSTFYPSALKKEGNRLIWVEVSGENVEKCIYKL